MMKNLVIALSLISMIFLTGCGDDSKSGKSITTRNNRGNPGPTDGSGNPVNSPDVFAPQGKALTGVIYENSGSLSQFRSSMDDFLSSFMDPSYVEYGSDFGLIEGRTGAVFGGLIEFNNINYQPAMHLDSSIQVNMNTAELRISIFDDLVGETHPHSDGSDKTYTEIPIDFTPGELVYARIYNGNSMYFIFEDVYGYVAISSVAFSQNESWSGGFMTYQGQTVFSGAVYYQNKTYYNSSQTVDYDPTRWKGLGYFVVPACGFFKCN